ncbi:MAG: hypothetical protein DRJ64_00745, partial [Thermoprotei archaeon]
VAGVNDSVLVYVEVFPRVEGKDIVIQYRLNDSGWISHTLSTNEYGWCLWKIKLNETGYYEFKAVWEGDQYYLPNTSDVVKILVRASPLSVEEYESAITQVEKLSREIVEKSRLLNDTLKEKKALEEKVSDLNSMVSELKAKVSSLEESLAEKSLALNKTLSELDECRAKYSGAEEQARLWLIAAIIFLILGLILGFFIGLNYRGKIPFKKGVAVKKS